MMIVNNDSRVINKLEASLTGNAGVVIYDHHMFIVKATGVNLNSIFGAKLKQLLRIQFLMLLIVIVFVKNVPKYGNQYISCSLK
jgi:hypothetical protein